MIHLLHGVTTDLLARAYPRRDEMLVDILSAAFMVDHLFHELLFHKGRIA